MSSDINPEDLPKYTKQQIRDMANAIEFKEERKKTNHNFETLKLRRPWFFNALGELKNKAKNKTCICGSGEKIKNCCGIQYK